MEKLEERLLTLLNFSDVVEKHPKYIGVFEVMVTGAAVKLNVPRKYIVDTLYYMKNDYNKRY